MKEAFRKFAWAYHQTTAAMWTSRWFWTLVGFNGGLVFTVLMAEIGHPL